MFIRSTRFVIYMINKNYFKKLQKEYDNNDKKREELIRKSRDVIKLSKHLIYSVHRKDMKSASLILRYES